MGTPGFASEPLGQKGELLHSAGRGDVQRCGCVCVRVCVCVRWVGGGGQEGESQMTPQRSGPSWRPGLEFHPQNSQLFIYQPVEE